MLSLPKLHQQYKKQHPQYHDPLARYSPEDQELEKIKRTALSPYLQQLEEQMIIFKDIIKKSKYYKTPKCGQKR